MLFDKLKMKIWTVLLVGLYAINTGSSICFSAGTASGYAAIWKAQTDIDRKNAAVACFDAIAALDTTVSNTTKHSLKHFVVCSELSGRLNRNLLCWLSYNGEEWGQRIAKLRQLLSDLYTTGNDINKIRKWVSGDQDITPTISTSFKSIMKFSCSLQNNRQILIDGGRILHTYDDGSGNIIDHIENDMVIIDNFTSYFPKETLTAKTVKNFLGDAKQARNKLKRLLYLQNKLFVCMNFMTAKLLKECFEPCMKAILTNAFHLQGVKQNAIAPILSGINFASSISINDYSEQESTLAIPVLTLAGIEGNPENADPLPEIPSKPAIATTVLKRTFLTGPEFTQFIRATVLVTNTGNPQAFTNLAENVIRVGNIVALPDTDSEEGGALFAPIKAEKQDLLSSILQNTTEYTIANRSISSANRRISSDPFLATFYFGIDKN